MTIISSQQRTETIIKVPVWDLTRKLTDFNFILSGPWKPKHYPYLNKTASFIENLEIVIWKTSAELIIQLEARSWRGIFNIFFTLFPPQLTSRFLIPVRILVNTKRLIFWKTPYQLILRLNTELTDFIQVRRVAARPMVGQQPDKWPMGARLEVEKLSSTWYLPGWCLCCFNKGEICQATGFSQWSWEVTGLTLHSS